MNTPKLNVRCAIALAALAAFLPPATMMAATNFTDPLTSANPARFTQADTSTPAMAITYSPAGASFSLGGDSARNYLRTVDSDYNTSNFTSSVNLATGNGADFFGFGPGNLGNSNEPGGSGPSNPSIYLRLRTGGSDQILTGGPFGNTLYTFTLDVGANANATLLLSYNVSASTLVFGIDTTGDGIAEESSTPIATTGFDATNSKIFFGGSGGSTSPAFSNFAVVPEPGTWAMVLAGMGLLGTFQFARRTRKA